MPEVQVVFFKRADEIVSIKDWLIDLTKRDRRKCLERMERLREQGHELGRPFAAHLKDGIYELRVKSENVNYRMLYFFHKGRAVVIDHGLFKKAGKVPPKEIERAVDRKLEFEEDPGPHLFNVSLEVEEKKLSSDAFQWAYNKYIGSDPKEVVLYEEERIKADIAQAVYNLRHEAGFSRRQIADLVDTTESVIEDIEEADFEEDFLLMASRIASAFHKRVEVRFV